MFSNIKHLCIILMTAVNCAAALSMAGNNQLRATRQLQSWYTRDSSGNQNPHNVNDLGGNRFQMLIKPGEEAVKIHSNQYYSSGRFEVSLKSASEMSGIITSFYLVSSDDVQRSDHDLGSQDELDFEFLGNDLYNAHTNVFIDGQQQAITIPIGNDHSRSENTYAIEWDNAQVRFYINGGQVRSHSLPRPLKPMKMSMAIWTTSGGWQGLKEWAGNEPDWNARGNQPIEATFQVLSFPN